MAILLSQSNIDWIASSQEFPQYLFLKWFFKTSFRRVSDVSLDMSSNSKSDVCLQFEEISELFYIITSLCTWHLNTKFTLTFNVEKCLQTPDENLQSNLRGVWFMFGNTTRLKQLVWTSSGRILRHLPKIPNKHQRFPVILNGPLCDNSLLIVHCRAFNQLETVSGNLWNSRFYGKHYLGESSLLDCKSKMIF